MAFINPNHPAELWHKEGDYAVCDLCPRRCRISPDGFGACNSRRNNEGTLVAYNYGRVSSLAVDPMEKKPLYHYKPGTSVFSVGGIGCNLHCEFCQNYSISMSPIGKKRTTYKSPEDLVGLCHQQRLETIAFTYNEPSIWLEYIEDVADADPDLDIVLVTNGMMTEECARRFCRVAKAMNIDVKAFDQDFYTKYCGGMLDAVKATCENVFRAGVHLELTYLVIPGLNDDPAEIREFVRWVRDSLSPDVPVHFTRFHPDYNMVDLPLTPEETLDMCLKTAEDNGLNYAYVGNIMSDDGNDTYCPECGAVIIKRTGYHVDIVGLHGNRCAACGERLNFRR